MFSGDASTYPQPITPLGICFNSFRISCSVFLLPALSIVRTGSASTYLYGMICVKPLRICKSKCDPLLGLELPKIGGASLKANRFQRKTACAYLPGLLRKRRSDFTAMKYNNGDTESRSLKILATSAAR